MVTCDIGRAGLLVLLPFWRQHARVSSSSRSRSRCSRCCGVRRRTRRVPNIVKDPDQLASANSLGLVAAFGTFPLGAVIFAVLAGVSPVARRLRRARPASASSRSRSRSGSTRSRSSCSAFLISRPACSTRASAAREQARPGRADLARHRRRAAVHPLEPARARRDDRSRGRADRRRRDHPARRRVSRRDVLGGGSGGVRLADDRARRRRRDRRRHAARGSSAGCRARRCSRSRSSRPASRSSRSASVSSLAPALVLVAAASARAPAARTSPASRCCRRTCRDDMRGRTFATLYTIVRAVPVAVADDLAVRRGRARRDLRARGRRRRRTSGRSTIALPGVRLALWLGGVDHACSSGLAARRRMRTPAPEPGRVTA